MSDPKASKSVARIGAGILGVGVLIAVLLAVLQGSEAPISRPSISIEEDKPVITHVAVAIPAIDKAIPKVIETATFAMG